MGVETSQITDNSVSFMQPVHANYKEIILGPYLHIEAETKWPPFSRRHFQMDFLEWQCTNFD